MISIGNLHCGYSLMSRFYGRRHEGNHMTFPKYFLVYNSSLKMPFSTQAMNLKIGLINFVKGLCNLKTRTRFQKKSLDQVDQILTNFI